jgi:hypothetical protein
VLDSTVAGNTNNGIIVSGSANVVLAIEATKLLNNHYGLVATGGTGMLVRARSHSRRRRNLLPPSFLFRPERGICAMAPRAAIR